MEDFYDILMDWSQNMARGIVFFKKLIFGVIFLEGYTLPPRQESFIIIVFSISYNRFTTFHFSLIRAEKREQRYRRVCAALRPTAITHAKFARGLRPCPVAVRTTRAAWR